MPLRPSGCGRLPAGSTEHRWRPAEADAERGLLALTGGDGATVAGVLGALCVGEPADDGLPEGFAGRLVATPHAAEWPRLQARSRCRYRVKSIDRLVFRC